ncbi:MAG TPA: VOC family protein [Vicinamibacterales bacterium]
MTRPFVARVLAVLVFVHPSVAPVQAGRSIALDHVVLAVNDLESTAAQYRRLGFALKPGRPHDNGIRNEHVKFTDGTELELLTAPAARDDMTSRYRRHLADGDGPAYLALFPRPEPPTPGAAPGYIFFGMGNQSPTDRPEHFAHPNTAERLIAVWLAGSDFKTERALFAAYNAPITPGRLTALDQPADVVSVAGGTVYLLPERVRTHRSRPVIGVTFRVRDLRSAERLLQGAGARFRSLKGSLVLDPDATRGLWIELAGLPSS